MPETILEEKTTKELSKLAKYIDYATLNKIINKLTDYAEILTVGKLSGLVNYNYRLNSTQTNEIIEFLLEIQAITKIHNIALKGSKDLDEEFVSNIFSDVISPNNLSSFVSLRNLLENRLSHQIQQYNVNMGKSNTTMAMPINELRGHTKTFLDLSKSNLSISTKAQHGIIAASLHDCYITFIARNDWWNDKTYMKFFYNEDDQEKRKTLILSRKPRVSPVEIKNRLDEVLNTFESIRPSIIPAHDDEQDLAVREKKIISERIERENRRINDKMLMTPFGRQYGNKIDTILAGIFDDDTKKKLKGTTSELISKKVIPLFDEYEINNKIIESTNNIRTITEIVSYLIFQDWGIKTFTEKYIYPGRKESFTRFYTEEIKDKIEEFLISLFSIFYNETFNSLFQIIKSQDMKKFSCAYIIKRIYVNYGEELTSCGYFLIKTIAKIGGIKSQ